MSDLNSPSDVSKGLSPATPGTVSEAVKTEVRQTKRRRPMSVPTRRLETSPIPGYHLHWIRQENLPQAIGASYQHVLEDEVEINTRNVALDSAVGGTADLSNRVSVQYGGDTLFLMKLDEALYNEDMAILAERNIEVWKQIFRGEQIAGAQQAVPGDNTNTYVAKAEATGLNLKRTATPLFARRFK